MTKTAPDMILTRDQNISAATKTCSEDVLFSADSNFEEIEMTFATDGIDFILDLLTDLSVNRGAYALREAFSNAYDATMAAGDMSKPIEITLPHIIDCNPDTPDTIAAALGYSISKTVQYAVVKDRGIGMTEDDVKLYFTQYGGSKKRNAGSIDTIGSKGLGSKAPLAVSDTFTVRTTKDGITTTALIERRGSRNYASITTEDTGEENGTEVRIPVSDVSVSNQMCECARQIAKNNLDATLVIDGEETKGILSTEDSSGQYVFVGDVVMGKDEDGNDVSFRVWESAECFPRVDFDNLLGIDLNLAGVSYVLEEKGSNYYRYGDRIPTFIVAGDPGYLNFTPSRDEIKQDDARERFLYAVKEGLAAFDFSDAVDRFLSDHFTIPALRLEWLRDNYKCHERVDSDLVKLVPQDELRTHEATITDDGKFDVDGQSLLEIVEDDEKKHFLVYRNGKSFHIVTSRQMQMLLDRADDNWYGINRGGVKCKKSDIVPSCPLFVEDDADLDIDIVSAKVSMRYVMARLAWVSSVRNFDSSKYGVVFLNGFSDIDKVRKFLSNENAIRPASTDEGTAFYVISKEDSFGEHDKAVIEGFGFNTAVYDYDSMIETGRAYRKARRESNKSNEGKAKTRKRQLPSNVWFESVTLDDVIDSKFANFEVNNESYDLNDEHVFDDAALVFGHASVNDVAVVAGLLRKTGKLDTSIEKIVFTSDRLSANDVRYLATKCNETVLVDVRDHVSVTFPGIFDECEDVKVAKSYSGVSVSNALLSAGWDGIDDGNKTALTISYAYAIASTKNTPCSFYRSASPFALFENFMGRGAEELFEDEDILFAFNFFKDIEQEYGGAFKHHANIPVTADGENVPAGIADDVARLVAASVKTFPVMDRSDLFSSRRSSVSDMFCEVVLPGLAAAINKRIGETDSASDDAVSAAA